MPTAGESNRVPSRPQPGEDTTARLDGGPGRRADAPSRPREPEFRGVLFDGATGGAQRRDSKQPQCFADLNLDQIVHAIIYRRGRYDLAPFFHTPLSDVSTIQFRQEVFADLELPAVRRLAVGFAERELVARHEAQQRSLREDDGGFAHYHRTCVFLNTVGTYCEAVEALAAGLAATDLRARGLLGLRDYLVGYLDSPAYRELREQTNSLQDDLDQIRYSFLLNGSRITVGPYDEQPDYSAEITETFERFRQTPNARELRQFPDWEDYSAIGVLHLAAKVHPEPFQRLERFCSEHAGYLDRTLAVFDRELQFYLSYLEYIAPLREAGLQFSYPCISAEDKSEQALDTFDLALAAKRIGDGDAVICNDVILTGPERILVITGPNNGGKTTLARAIGQLHYLAKLGCPVPGRDTQLFLCGQIYTRFERQEDIATLSGKLQDELNRLHAALQDATPASLFIFNEMFNSTTAHDALFLSREILGRVSALDALCVCVTFLDELTGLDDKTVSMVSTVDPEDPAIRTYKVIRRAADGRAYARAVAEKYGLTYAQLTTGDRT